MGLIIEWFSNMFEIEKSTLFLIGFICVGGTAFLKSTFDNGMLAFIFYPVLMLASLLIYAGLLTIGAFTPVDWLKGAMISAACGNAAGVIAIIVIMHGMDDVSTALQTDGKVGQKSSRNQTVARINSRVERAAKRT